LTNVSTWHRYKESFGGKQLAPFIPSSIRGVKTNWQLKQSNLTRENRRIGVAAGIVEETSAECEEKMPPAGGKSEETKSLKKHFKMT